MNATLQPDARAAHLERAERQKAVAGRGVRLVLVAVLIALGLRSLVYEPFNIPSESMLPRLLIGDYLFVAKWPYGIGRYSLPLGLPLFDGRIGGSLPKRGDIIVFKTPRDNRTDYIKRIIGLPGDTVAMQNGRIVLNGAITSQRRTADFMVRADNAGCDSGPGRPNFSFTGTDGGIVCRYPAFIETMPDGRNWVVLDQIVDDVRDTTAPITIPAGHVFVLGDNRDDSADSRFRIDEGGVGLVPIGNIMGRADRIFFSIEPGASLLRPGQLASMVRADRIGSPL